MGSRLAYYLLILPISILPYPLLYLLSDFVYFMIFYVSGYRKKVVLSNIQNSFPEKSVEEHKLIMKKFYHHFCDIILESLKGFTVSEKQVRKRMIVRNPELLNQYAEKNQNIILVGGHYNNWEIFAHGIGLVSKHQPIGIYKPLKNLFFNQKILDSRQKFELVMCSMKETAGYFKKDIEKPKAIIFASDQSPSNPKKCYWMDFLNQETGVLFGVEKFGKEYDLPIIYGTIHKVKRGYYEVEFELLFESCADVPYGQITETHTKRLEKDIIDAPEYWLWSHRRWKHKRPKEN